MQGRRTVGQRQQAKFAARDGYPGRSSKGPVRQQLAAAHVEPPDAGEHLAFARQDDLPIKQDADPRPVGDRDERGHWRLHVRNVEQTGDVEARPRRPSHVAEPAHPRWPAADRAGRTHPHETVPDGEARLDNVLGQYAVAVVAEDPVGLLCRLQDLVRGSGLLGRQAAQRARAYAGEVHLIQAGHHEIGPRPVQQGLVPQACDAERSHAPGLRGFDPCGRVLDHQALLRGDAELLGGQEEERRIRLAPRHVAAAQIGVEDGQQFAPVRQLQMPQHGVGVLRRGSERKSEPRRMQSGGQADGIRESLEATLCDEPVDQRLLDRRVVGRAVGRVRDAELLKRSPRARHARLSCHVGLVEPSGEARRIGQAHQRLAPRSLMRRGDEDAVHVEDRCRQGQRHGGAS